MASSSSSSASQCVYDVFLSFRGEDTRRNFVAHLNASLSNAKINTYIDDRLQKGRNLEPELLRAINVSRISIVVFSENYVRSSWCLKEFEEIMKCRRECGQVVLPVFYHVDPSDLRHQGGDFRKALGETAKRSSAEGKKMRIWHDALTEVANISGWHTKQFRDDVELILKIVEDVSRKLESRSLNITKFPVGLDTRVQKMINFIDNQSSKVCLIGIWGMGGLGKTTTAKAIYNHNQFHEKFVVHRFVENIREVCEKGNRGDIHLNLQHLLDNMKTCEKDFMGKRALVVLDDVSTLNQVEALCQNRKCFGKGSVLVVISRDLHILKLLKADPIYSIKEMDENKSLELFSWHAFREQGPKADFNELSSKIVAYCGGLPLALEEIGSDLRGRTKQDWISALSKLERIPNHRVLEKLKISYDGLKDDYLEKDIFLDICCFFIGKDRAYVTEILNGCELFAVSGINVLIERSLLKVDKNNKLGMHGLLRDMGREIVRERSMKKLGKCSRLWFHDDAHKVLAENTGTETVEGLVLMMQSTNNVCIKTFTFKNMKNLRLLQLHQVDLTGAFGCLSQELRWLQWHGFTREDIPDDFYLGKLVVFELQHSNIKQVWKETKLMENLKILNLSHSKYLTTTPDFSKLPNLEKLIMEDCPNLSELHQTIGDLEKILLINLKDCTSLSNLPNEIYKLTSFTTLILSGCSKIDKFEEDILQMNSLTTLRAPLAQVLDILLPGISPSGNMTLSLDPINLQNNNVGFLSSIASLSHFRTVWIQCHSEIQLTQAFERIIDDQHDTTCKKLEASQISNLSWRSLFIRLTRRCDIVTDALGRSKPQELTTNDSRNLSLPGGIHPSWLAYTGEGPSTLFEVPKDIDCHVEGIILRVFYSSTSENKGKECFAGVLIINYTKSTVHIYKRDTVLKFNDEDWKGLASNLEPGDNVKIFVDFGNKLIVKKTTVYLITGESIIVEVDDANMEMEPSEEVNVQPFPEVKQSPKSNKSIFTRLPDRMGACLWLNEHTNIGLGACLCLNHNTDG